MQRAKSHGSSTEAVHSLWDAMAGFPAAQTEAALLHLMKTLTGWLHADNAVWVGSVRIASGAAARRDPQHGWRGRAVRHLHAPPAVQAASRQAVKGQDIDPGMTTRAVTAHAGTFRHFRLRDGFIDFKAFQRTTHYRALYEAVGITDRLWVMCPVTRDAEACYLLDIYRSRRRFPAKDALLAAQALRGLKWFHQRALLSYGLLAADSALSPVQRKLLAALLTERSEKEIAADLDLTPGTTHQYVVELCRKFGVSGRAGLMATWLGRPPPPTDQ